jgi:hypothetical protein
MKQVKPRCHGPHRANEYDVFGHDSQTDAKQEHEVFGMEKSLADRVALITGAARGQGRAIAIPFLSE